MGHQKTPQQLWIQAAMEASQGPEARVRCPSCKQGTLVVFDVAAHPTSDQIERVFCCPTCQARNEARMPRRPEENGRFIELLLDDPDDVRAVKWQNVLAQFQQLDTAQRKAAVQNLLEKYLQQAYEMFSRYPLQQHFEGCPCCVNDSDQQRLRSRPLNELTSEDLSKYASKAMTTWGDELDFKHFLPRLLELEVKKGRMWSLYSKLNFAQWTSWPEEEQESVRQVLLTRWKLSLLEAPEPHEAPSLGDLMEAEYDLAPYLEGWEGLNHLHAWGHLSHFVVLYGQAILDGTWEEEHPRKSLQVKRWLIRPEMLNLLQQQFEVHLESPFSGVLADGIDVLSSLLSAADAHK